MQNYTDGYTKTCGLIGNPVKHTLSPLIHNALAEMTGINMVYVPFEVQPEEVKAAIKGATALNLGGLNVTVPYKSDVIPYLEAIDPLAESIGAVNTLVRYGKGFKGYNTDMTGLYHAMKDEGIELLGKTVVILGAGGVARPTAYLCASKGAKRVIVLNRTYEKALAIAEEINGAISKEDSNEPVYEALDENKEAVELEEAKADVVAALSLDDYKSIYDMLDEGEKFFAIQCTSVGLFPDVNSAVIEDEAFYSHVYAALDVVYRPLETKFMKLAKSAGAITFSGLKMLLYQGIDAFELWNEEEGVKISKDQADEVYRSLVMEVIGCRNIILEGFMGCGKSTVSELLADQLSMELVDTDEVIEDTEKRTISDIFAKEGESYFRDLETELVSTIVDEKWRMMVVSLGGGLPLRKENRELLKKAGKVIYLRTKPETVYERLKGDDTRPLLRSENPMERIKELLDVRGEVYEKAADMIIDTDGLTPQEVAERIIKEIF